VNPNLILVAVGLAALLAAEGVYYLVRWAGEQERAELRRRLRALDEAGGGNLLRRRRIARSAGLERMLALLPGVVELEQLLLQTDLTWTVASTLGGSIVTASGLGVVVLSATRIPVVGVGAALFGFLLPILWILIQRSQRSLKLSEQLPEALDMIVRSLRAGHGVASGFKLVATEMPMPIAVEFGRCFEEQSVGVEFRQAVQNMTQRVPQNLDLKIFAVSIVIQHETGGNLVEILEQIAGMLRERFKFYGKLRALTAEGRVSAVILGSLPFVAAILISIMNEKYLLPLFSDPIGHGILMGGLISWVFGFLWLRSLTQVDF
jgi:tight adherence protein B